MPSLAPPSNKQMPGSPAPSADINVTDVPLWDAGLASSPSSSTASSVLRMALVSLILCVSLFGNVVVLLVFQRKPQLLHVANRFVLNLILADLLQTTLVMPFAIAATVPGVWPLDARLCQALVALMHLFAFAGVNTIVVVSVDRYLAIIHPLSYPTRMTPHLGTNLIVCTWVFSLLQSTPPLYGWGGIAFDRRRNMCSVVWSSSPSYSAAVSASSFWLPVLIMLGCYWMVFRAARRQNALVHPVQTQSHSQPCAQDSQAPGSPRVRQPRPQQASSPGGPSRGYPVRVRHRRFHYHCKAARVVFMIMASYILSMGPYSILNTVSINDRVAVPPWLSSLALVLFFLQCCLHPYIYGYMHRSVRKEFLALLCGLLCQQRGRASQSSAAESCFATAEGRAAAAANSHLPCSATARVFPLRTWEECTTSSSPTCDRRSGDSRRETTASTSVSSDRELTVHS